jgi:hypothetical protein
MRGKGRIEQGVLIHERRTLEYPSDVRRHLLALGRIGVHEETLSAGTKYLCSDDPQTPCQRWSLARDGPLIGEHGSYLIIIYDNLMSSSLPQAPHAYAFSPEVAPAPSSWDIHSSKRQ